MTVQSPTSRITYPGTGVITPLPVPFRFLDNSHLLVQTVDANGVETTLVINSQYTVSGARDPNGGTVTPLIVVPVGTTTVISRNVPLTQLADYKANDPFPEETNEDMGDKLVMIDQQQQDQIDRSFKLPVTVVGVSATLPVPSALKPLVWNASANALENGDTTLTGDMLLRPNLALSTGAGLVNYVLSKSGAVVRTLLAKLRDLPTVKDFAATGNGTSDDRAAIALADAANCLRFPEGTYRISSNITLNSTAIFDPGAVLSVDAGATVTFTRQVQAPIQQIFSGAGTVLAASRNQRAYVEWFGAVANSTGAPASGTDCTAAINKCVAFAKQTLLGSMGIYRHADTLLFDFDDVFIAGYGDQYTSQLCFDDATGLKNAIVFGNGVTKRNNFLTHNFVQIRAQSSTAGAAIRINDGGLVNLAHRIYSNSLFFRGVYASKAIYLNFRQPLKIEGCIDNGVRIDGTSVATADKSIDIIFEACRIEGTSNGSALVQFGDFCEGVFMTSTILYAAGTGYTCSFSASSFAAGTRSVHLTAVNFDTGAGGLFMNHVYNADINAPWLSNVSEGITISNGGSIQINGGQGLIVGGGIAINAGSGGATSCEDLSVIGFQSILGGTGIFLSAACTGTVINGCIIRNMSAYGINKFLNPTDTIITSNRIKNNTSGNISAGGAGALIVANNDAP